MAWNGSHLRVAPDMEHAHDVALGFARMLGLACFAIRHITDDGVARFVASDDPAGSGLCVVECWRVSPTAAPMLEPVSDPTIPRPERGTIEGAAS